MLTRLLESRLIDVLLIAAALYFLLPRLFSRIKRKEDRNSEGYMRANEMKSAKKPEEQRGEYIDYEEMK